MQTQTIETLDLISTFSRGVYFYCVAPREAHRTQYLHNIICLAEGLKDLGIPVYANLDFWKLTPDSNEYLLSHHPDVSPDDCDLVVLDHNWFQLAHQAIPEKLFKPDRRYLTVYLDGADGSLTQAWSEACRPFDFIFKNHTSAQSIYPPNFYPWAFGLSQRMLKEVQDIPPFEHRQSVCLVNYRESKIHRHSLRHYVCDRILPELDSVLPIWHAPDDPNVLPRDPYTQLQWAQTGRRHSEEYFRKLLQVQACAAFGGFFVADSIRNHASKLSRLSKKLLSKLRLKSRAIVQWDSWRLWESLAAGCVTLHVDFEKYGLLPPVPLENWRHYIGFDLDNPNATLDRIRDEPTILNTISREGRAWVLEHYAPKPTALRFLQTISIQSGKGSTCKPKIATTSR